MADEAFHRAEKAPIFWVPPQGGYGDKWPSQ